VSIDTRVIIMSRTAARLALLFSLTGLVASGAAAYVHYRLLNDAGYLSFCDVSATVSCTQVYASRYGSFAGVPVAVFGTLWFAVATALSWAGLSAREEVRESVPAYLFAGSTLALAAVLYLGYASFVLLGLVCPLCIVTYVGAIGLFLVAGAATTIPMTSLPARAADDVRVLAGSPLALAVAVVLVGGGAAALAYFPREAATANAPEAAAAVDPPESQAADFERFYTAQPRVTLDVPAEGAKVLVVKFNDYQCPPCRQSHMDYKEIFAKYESSHPGAVRYVLKDFPLESECNAAVTTALHEAGCEAAVAVRLARPRKQAGALEDWLFANQPALTPALVRQAAREVGQVPDFESRYALTLDLVRADIAYGRQLGVRSTPTFFVNGVKLEGALPAVYFDQAIAYELKRAEAPATQ
jgi:uncharacterized membrane protein/protein-disulfide isomerase